MYVTYISHLFVIFAVQFRWQIARSEGKFNEASARRNNDQDGGARKGIHEGQAKGRKEKKTFSTFSAYYKTAKKPNFYLIHHGGKWERIELFR